MEELPEGAAAMKFSLWDHSYAWGHISITVTAMEANHGDLSKALLIARTPSTPLLLSPNLRIPL
ncbi:hypothetical protein AMTR_s00060p00209020 [Amborella trichopoda]|uniref:Uncharacterized protein n=1 Tax=Amborella trichopoda TaxID=13333 RepID=W1NL59_AMBTC|nr:hypothetical protein AMTR_s00060p00209020 [Amborella trichopoda]